MAKTTSTTLKAHRIKKKTSIGKSNFSRPSNKSQKLSWKKYRGQG